MGERALRAAPDRVRRYRGFAPAAPAPFARGAEPDGWRAPWWCRSLAVVAALAAAVAGALWLEFLCDDAFITFRFVSNAHDGHGLVWNPPPFAPVEGYTSFLWAVALWAVWSLFDVEPTRSANVMSIACGVGLAVVTLLAARRIRTAAGRRVSDVVVLLVLLAVVCNRNVLLWMTSGLETALFNLVFVTWVVLAFRPAARQSGAWLFAWSLVAAMVALTRPDGLLAAAATCCVAAAGRFVGRHSTAATLAGLSPLLLVVAHLGWRVWFYGEWLPNTYYAKVAEPWPEAGWRYLQCFAFENGTYLLLPLACAWVVVTARRRAWSRALSWLPATAAVSVVLAHLGYYTLRVGGDHYEYRVLCPLVPFAALGVAAMAAQLRGSAFAAVSVGLLGIASAVGWGCFALTDFRQPPDYDPLADHVPAFAAPAARWYDRRRLWLQMHFVGVRVARVDTSLEAVFTRMPERRRWPVDQGDIPVASLSAIGVPGWVLPDCAVLDRLGLCDWVAARTPASNWAARQVPQDLLERSLAAADVDGDGCLTRPELERMVAAWPGATEESAGVLAKVLLVLFAEGRRDQLEPAEVARVPGFFAGLRLMAHERLAPSDYEAALDPNVTIEGTEVVVRERQRPLSADDVRAIEARWRRRLQR